MQSWIDYILGTDRRLFQNVSVRDSRHNTYHYLVLCCLCIAAPAAHLRYLRKQTRFTINPPKTPDGVGRLFAEIQGGFPKAP